MSLLSSVPTANVPFSMSRQFFPVPRRSFKKRDINELVLGQLQSGFYRANANFRNGILEESATSSSVPNSVIQGLLAANRAQAERVQNHNPEFIPLPPSPPGSPVRRGVRQRDPRRDRAEQNRERQRRMRAERLGRARGNRPEAVVQPEAPDNPEFIPLPPSPPGSPVRRGVRRRRDPRRDRAEQNRERQRRMRDERFGRARTVRFNNEPVPAEAKYEDRDDLDGDNLDDGSARLTYLNQEVRKEMFEKMRYQRPTATNYRGRREEGMRERRRQSREARMQRARARMEEPVEQENKEDVPNPEPNRFVLERDNNLPIFPALGARLFSERDDLFYEEGPPEKRSRYEDV
jgi:hypothetical protein